MPTWKSLLTPNGASRGSCWLSALLGAGEEPVAAWSLSALQTITNSGTRYFSGSPAFMKSMAYDRSTNKLFMVTTDGVGGWYLGAFSYNPTTKSFTLLSETSLTIAEIDSPRVSAQDGIVVVTDPYTDVFYIDASGDGPYTPVSVTGWANTSLTDGDVANMTQVEIIDSTHWVYADGTANLVGVATVSGSAISGDAAAAVTALNVGGPAIFRTPEGGALLTADGVLLAITKTGGTFTNQGDADAEFTIDTLANLTAANGSFNGASTGYAGIWAFKGFDPYDVEVLTARRFSGDSAYEFATVFTDLATSTVYDVVSPAVLSGSRNAVVTGIKDQTGALKYRIDEGTALDGTFTNAVPVATVFAVAPSSFGVIPLEDNQVLFFGNNDDADFLFRVAAYE